MDDLDKLNKIERLMQYFSEGERNRSLNKMAGKISDKMFKDLCKEYEMCNICGKELDKEATFAIKIYSSGKTKYVNSSGCPDDACEYNKNTSERLKYEENWGRVL